MISAQVFSHLKFDYVLYVSKCSHTSSLITCDMCPPQVWLCVICVQVFSHLKFDYMWYVPKCFHTSSLITCDMCPNAATPHVWLHAICAQVFKHLKFDYVWYVSKCFQTTSLIACDICSRVFIPGYHLLNVTFNYVLFSWTALTGIWWGHIEIENFARKILFELMES